MSFDFNQRYTTEYSSTYTFRLLSNGDRCDEIQKYITGKYAVGKNIQYEEKISLKSDLDYFPTLQIFLFDIIIFRHEIVRSTSSCETTSNQN